jgi:hypothetical protein
MSHVVATVGAIVVAPRKARNNLLFTEQRQLRDGFTVPASMPLRTSSLACLLAALVVVQGITLGATAL